MECIMSTKSKISVLLLAGIQWVRRSGACKVFWKHMSMYFTVHTEFVVISM